MLSYSLETSQLQIFLEFQLLQDSHPFTYLPQSELYRACSSTVQRKPQTLRIKMSMASCHPPQINGSSTTMNSPQHLCMTCRAALGITEYLWHLGDLQGQEKRQLNLEKWTLQDSLSSDGRWYEGTNAWFNLLPAFLPRYDKTQRQLWH